MYTQGNITCQMPLLRPCCTSTQTPLPASLLIAASQRHHLRGQLVAGAVLGGAQDEPGHGPAARHLIRLAVLQLSIICQVAAVHHAARGRQGRVGMGGG